MAQESNKLDAIKVKYFRFDINGTKKQRHPDDGGALLYKYLKTWFYYIYFLNLNKPLKISILQNI